MRNTLTIVLSGLLLCGCSQKQAVSIIPAIDLVRAGKDVVWADGRVLHVAKRDGAALEGIQIVTTNSILKADSGTVSQGSLEDAADPSSIKIVLKNVRCETTNSTAIVISTASEWTIVLHERL